MHESDAKKKIQPIWATPHHTTPDKPAPGYAMLCSTCSSPPSHPCMYARTHARSHQSSDTYAKTCSFPLSPISTPFHSLSTGPTPIPITSYRIVYHSLSLALPVGPPPPCCASSPSPSTSNTSSPASMANSALCSVARSSVLRGSTSSEGFSLALLRTLFVPPQN